MLKRTWGSLHTYPDHRDTSNICLLCRAMALWFSLVRKLIEENTKRKMESEGHDEGTDLGSPTVTRRGSILKIKSLTPTSHKRKKAVSVAEGMEAAVFKSGKKVSGESIEFVDYDGSRSQAGRRSVDILQEIPRLKVDRPRKLAMVQSHSEFEVVSCRGGAAAVTPPSLPPAYKEETQEDAIPPIYKIFQLCTTVSVHLSLLFTSLPLTLYSSPCSFPPSFPPSLTPSLLPSLPPSQLHPQPVPLSLHVL